MSKLDRFLVSDGIFLEFPSISALCLDRHLSDHRPILLHEIQSDFGPVPFRFYHSWFSFEGFDDMVKRPWLSFSHSDGKRMIRFKKKLQDLKVIIRLWIKDKRLHLEGAKTNISKELQKIDKEMDSGVVSDTNRFRRLDLIRQLHDIKAKEATDALQKSKVRWAVEGDENSKFFHGPWSSFSDWNSWFSNVRFFRRLSAYWKAFFVSLGGPYGSCGTALYLMLLLLSARRSLTI
nr:RNA-directed DNA polymerase, eukaryota [Tanacetum cinerariifolium]